MQSLDRDLAHKVDQLTSVLETVRAQNELLGMVQRAQSHFLSDERPETVFGNLLDDLLVLTRSGFGFIGELLKSEEGRIYLRNRAISDIAWDEESQAMHKRFAEDRGLDFHNIRGLWETVLLTGEPVISNDPESDPRRSQMPSGHPKLESFLGIPFHSKGDVVGMAGIANRPGGYDKSILEFLQPYVATCAHIIRAYRIENERRVVEQQLASAYEDLERTVTERTAQLTREIEGHKETEWHLCESEEKFRSVFENCSDGIMVTSPLDGQVLAVNPAACRMFRCSEEELRADGANVFFDFLDPEFVQFMETLRSIGRAGGEMDLKRRDRSTIAVEIRGTLFRDITGDEKSVLVICDITERKRTEKKLLESENKYRTLYEESADGIFLLDNTGTILDANRAALEMYGYSLDELVHTKAMNLIHPEDLKVTSFRIQGIVKGESLRIERRVRKKDGTYLPVEVSASRLDDDLVQGLHRDVTERRLIEEARQKAVEASEILDRMFSSTHYCMVYLDRSFNFVRVNTAYADTCGHSPEFFQGKNHFDLYPNPENESIFREVVDSGEPFTVYAKPFEFPNDPKRGITYWDWSLFPVKDSEGCVEGLVFILVDVTEHKRAEQAVRESEQRFRTLFDQGPLGMAVMDQGCRFLEVNLAFCRITGYSEEELLHRSVADIAHPDDVNANTEFFKRLSERKIPRLSTEIRYIKKNGDAVWVNLTGSVLSGPNGEQQYLGMLEDISDRRWMQDLLRRRAEDLARSNKELEQFAYVASHDLQEPLRNVTSCLQLLERKYKGSLGAEADQYIHYAVDSTTRMKALIQDLLSYSRIATRGKPLERIDCEQILEVTLKNLRSAIAEAGAVITHDPLPPILGDDTQLVQVFQNVIQNAIKFRKDEPPRVHVSSVKSTNEWIFSIKDNGIGIESRHWDRIFVIFQQLNKKTQYEGTGMGLAIVKKVVERHGGRVWVESEPGIGTTFYFAIPEDGTLT